MSEEESGAEVAPKTPAERVAAQPTPPRSVTVNELRRGLQLETLVVHKLEIDLGFVFSA